MENNDKLLVINRDGETKFTIYPNGEVVKKSSFPCSTAGRNFMQTIVREGHVGCIGTEGYEDLLLNPHYSRLDLYNRSSVGYNFQPGICKDSYGRNIL